MRRGKKKSYLLPKVTLNRSLHKPLDQPFPPREEIKMKKEFNLEPQEKEILNTIYKIKKKKERKKK